MSSRVSSTALLHEHDPTMDARIVHAVNVSNKKEIAHLKHKAKSLAGSRDVSLHIYRQEEKDLVKHLFKLQQEKQRRHPEIEYIRRSVEKVSEPEQLIQSQDFHHRGSTTQHEHVVHAQDSRTSHQDSDSSMSLLKQYIQDAVYQPIGYGHKNKEYIGLQQDATTRRQVSVPDGKLSSDFRSHTMTSHEQLSHPAVANALASKHQINVNFHPQRRQSSTMAFLDPSTLNSSHSSEVRHSKDKQPPDVSVHEDHKPVSQPLNSEEVTDQQTKRRTVMFSVKSPPHTSPSDHQEHGVRHETAREGSADKMAAIDATSSLESMYDTYELSQSRRESKTRAIIEQEHQKLDSIIESFRQSFPVKKELDWQKTHPKPSPASQRGPFVAHTPPHHVSSKESSITSDTHKTEIHEASHPEVDHHHRQHGERMHDIPRSHHHVYSHPNVTRRAGYLREQSSHVNGSHENTSRSKESQFNIIRSQRQSHPNIGLHQSFASQFSVERRDDIGSIYNMPKEAVEDYRNLIEQASYVAHHPSTREPHISHHTAGIPHSHPPKRHFKKSRQKLLALHLLANQQRQENAARAMADPPQFNPVDTLMCRYLRLSALNVETLVDMCNESGVAIGIHPHMSIEDVAKFVFQQKSSEDESNAAALEDQKHIGQSDKRDEHDHLASPDQETT